MDTHFANMRSLIQVLMSDVSVICIDNFVEIFYDLMFFVVVDNF